MAKTLKNLKFLSVCSISASDLARPGSPRTFSGHSRAQFPRPKRHFFGRLSLRVCALQHFYVLLQLYRLDIATKKLARAYMIPYIYLT